MTDADAESESAATAEDADPEEDLSPHERAARDGEQMYERLKERKREANAPLDLAGDPDAQAGHQIQIVNAYEECLDRGKTELAQRLQEAETIGEQRTLADVIRYSDYQATPADLDEGPAAVKAKYDRGEEDG